MLVKVQILVAIIGSVLVLNNKFVTGFPTSRELDTKPQTNLERSSPCNVVDVQPNVINESRTDNALDISERTAGLIAQIQDITKYVACYIYGGAFTESIQCDLSLLNSRKHFKSNPLLSNVYSFNIVLENTIRVEVMSEHSKLLSILCEKETTLPSALISEISPIKDNKATDFYVKYLEQLNDFWSTIHNFNDQCTNDYDSDLSSQLQDFGQRIQSTICAMEIGLRGMGIYTRNLGASPVDNISDSECQSWSVRICQIYSFFRAASGKFNKGNNIFQEVDHKVSVIIG